MKTYAYMLARGKKLFIGHGTESLRSSMEYQAARLNYGRDKSAHVEVVTVAIEIVEEEG